MIRFLAFVMFFIAFLAGAIDLDPFWSAICLFSFVFMIVGLKPFTEPENVATVIKKDKSYKATVALTALILGGISFGIYVSPVWDIPEALNPPENLRIGDTDYFERMYSVKEIEEAKKAIAGGAVQLGTVTDTGSFIVFFFTLALLYISLITFNAHWNNSKALTFGWLFALLVLISTINKGNDDYDSEPYKKLDAVSTLNKLYPVSMDHCESSYYKEGKSSTVDWENKSETYIVEAGSLSSVVTVTSDNKDLAYKPGTEGRTISIGVDSIEKSKSGYAFCSESTSGSEGIACDELLSCVSAVHSISMKGKQEFVNLSYDQASEILSKD